MDVLNKTAAQHGDVSGQRQQETGCYSHCSCSGKANRPQWKCQESDQFSLFPVGKILQAADETSVSGDTGIANITNSEQLSKKIISSMLFDVKAAVEMKHFIASYTVCYLQVFSHHQWKGLELVTPVLVLLGVWHLPLLCSYKCFLVSPFGKSWFGDCF